MGARKAGAELKRGRRPIPPAATMAAPLPPSPRAPARVFVVEGEIAAGKSELVRALTSALRAAGLRVATALEPVESWQAAGILEKFYADPARHGYGFQTYVYATRILGIADMVASAPDADVYLLERSPATDAVFMHALRAVVDPVETRMYATWRRAYDRMLPLDLSAATVLYLRTDLGHCMARLSARARAGELPATAGAPAHEAEASVAEASVAGAPAPEAEASAAGGVTLGYQQHLRALHEAFFLGTGPCAGPSAEPLPPSPFPRASVVCIGPELANLDWRAGAVDAAALGRIVALMGLGL